MAAPEAAGVSVWSTNNVSVEDVRRVVTIHNQKRWQRRRLARPLTELIEASRLRELYRKVLAWRRLTRALNLPEEAEVIEVLEALWRRQQKEKARTLGDQVCRLSQNPQRHRRQKKLPTYVRRTN